jgi:hypothetical protein
MILKKSKYSPKAKTFTTGQAKVANNFSLVFFFYFGQILPRKAKNFYLTLCIKKIG